MSERGQVERWDSSWYDDPNAARSRLRWGSSSAAKVLTSGPDVGKLPTWFHACRFRNPPIFCAFASNREKSSGESTSRKSSQKREFLSRMRGECCGGGGFLMHRSRISRLASGSTESKGTNRGVNGWRLCLVSSRSKERF